MISSHLLLASRHCSIGSAGRNLVELAVMGDRGVEIRVGHDPAVNQREPGAQWRFVRRRSRFRTG